MSNNKAGFITTGGEVIRCESYRQGEVAEVICKVIFNKEFHSSIAAEAFLLSKGYIEIRYSSVVMFKKHKPTEAQVEKLRELASIKERNNYRQKMSILKIIGE